MKAARRRWIRAAAVLAGGWFAAPAAILAAPVFVQGVRLTLPPPSGSCGPGGVLVALIAAPAGPVEAGAWEGLRMPGARLQVLSGEAAMAAAGEADFLVVGARGGDELSLALARRLCRESRAADHTSVLVVAGDAGGHALVMPSSTPVLFSLVREVSRDLFADFAPRGCPAHGESSMRA